MSDRPRLVADVEAFNKVAESLKAWGATDSEPRWTFNNLMRKAMRGEPWTDFDYTRWELFESVPGWRTASIRLTAAAKKVYTKLQKASILDVKAVSEWYGW